MTVRMRMTKSKTGSRRSHHALDGVRVGNDVDGLSVPHKVSLDGKYKGRVIIDTTKRMERIKRNKENKKAAKRQGNVSDEKNTIEKIETPKLEKKDSLE